jgi:protein SCO1/2
MILTPGGTISRYFYGIEYGVRDIRLGLVEASNNRIGSAADQIKLLCYRYDPMTGKYGFFIMNSIRVTGVLTVGALVGFIVVMLRKERKNASGIHQNA